VSRHAHETELESGNARRKVESSLLGGGGGGGGGVGVVGGVVWGWFGVGGGERGVDRSPVSGRAGDRLYPANVPLRS